jgi:hypothetical protein
MSKITDALMASNFKHFTYEYKWNCSNFSIKKIDGEVILHEKYNGVYSLIEEMCTWFNLERITDKRSHHRMDSKKHYSILKETIMEIIRTDNANSYKFFLDDYGISFWEKNEEKMIFLDPYWEGFVKEFFRTFHIGIMY